MLSKFTEDRTAKTMELLGITLAQPVVQPKAEGLTFLSVMVREVYRNMPKPERYDVLANRTLPARNGNVTIIAALTDKNVAGGNAWVHLVAPIQTRLDDDTVVFTDELYPVNAFLRVSVTPIGEKDGKGREKFYLGAGELMRVGTTKDGNAQVVTHAVENPVEGGRQREGIKIGGKGKNVWQMEVPEA